MAMRRMIFGLPILLLGVFPPLVTSYAIAPNGNQVRQATSDPNRISVEFRNECPRRSWHHEVEVDFTLRNGTVADSKIAGFPSESSSVADSSQFTAGPFEDYISLVLYPYDGSTTDKGQAVAEVYINRTQGTTTVRGHGDSLLWGHIHVHLPGCNGPFDIYAGGYGTAGGSGTHPSFSCSNADAGMVELSMICDDTPPTERSSSVSRSPPSKTSTVISSTLPVQTSPVVSSSKPPVQTSPISSIAVGSSQSSSIASQPSTSVRQSSTMLSTSSSTGPQPTFRVDVVDDCKTQTRFKVNASADGVLSSSSISPTNRGTELVFHQLLDIEITHGNGDIGVTTSFEISNGTIIFTGKPLQQEDAIYTYELFHDGCYPDNDPSNKGIAINGNIREVCETDYFPHLSLRVKCDASASPHPTNPSSPPVPKGSPGVVTVTNIIYNTNPKISWDHHDMWYIIDGDDMRFEPNSGDGTHEYRFNGFLAYAVYGNYTLKAENAEGFIREGTGTSAQIYKTADGGMYFSLALDPDQVLVFTATVFLTCGGEVTKTVVGREKYEILEDYEIKGECEKTGWSLVIVNEFAR